MTNETWLWVGFNLFVLAMLALDLGVFHRQAHEVKIKEALAWSALWIGLSLVFNLIIWRWRGPEVAMEFLSAYLLEKALSVDNIFVFIIIFSYFKVPALLQHKVLFWGIIGALLMRAACIAAGITLLKQFHWLIYVFGAFLILTGIKMALSKGKEIDPGKNPLLGIVRRLIPVTDEYEGDRFFVRRDARLWATPLFVTLVFIELTDLVFAIDSIPAVLSITQEPFIVYTSNVFAILGLRALYFALAGVIGLFYYLHYGLSAVLIFVGIKMMIADIYKMPITVSLSVIAGILLFSVALSLLCPPAHKPDIVAEIEDAEEPKISG